MQQESGAIAPHEIAERIASCAARRPDAAALVGARARMSYAELDRAASRVAAALRARGVEGGYVGLLESRSIGAVAAMLGILRAGAAYVPLDPTHARERLPHIARDLPLAAAIVAARHAGEAGALDPSVPRLDLDEAMAFDGSAAVAPRGPEDPAYVLYTSGTTGAPKGVVVPRRALGNFCLGQPFFDVREDDVVLHAATIAADGSVFDIWCALMNGAAIAVVEQELPALSDIAAVMTRERVTVGHIYTGLHHLLIDRHPEAFATMRLDAAGGDVMSAGHVGRLRALYPDLRIVNIYGPTECTVSALGHEVRAEDIERGIPLGSPFEGYEPFLVDDEGRPCEGEGQIAIGGLGVALGYHGRPERTAESFVPDPRPGREGTVYLTGDLGRIEDGLFRFAGRADRQVKLGGRRIELDGVERALNMQEGVTESVVHVLGEGERRRLAVAVRVEEMPRDARAFERRVLEGAAAEIGDDVLPRTLAVLEEFPLSPNGKIDRRAVAAMLEAPTLAAAAAPARAAPAAGAIRAVWERVLGAAVPEGASFFEAGGNSMQIIEAHGALEEAFGPFPIAEMFSAPDAASLARRIGARPARAAPAPEDRGGRDVAIVAMAARLPGLPSIEAFHEAVAEGRTVIAPLGELEDDPARREGAYVPVRPVLDGADLFDAAAFEMLGREAELTDPQHRVFLELCLEALERGGLDPQRRPDVGVWAGATLSTYLIGNLLSDRAAARRFVEGYPNADMGRLAGTMPDALATRVAHKLGLTGPAMGVATACSTSLTAIAQAVQALRSGQVGAALAGGVSITFPQSRGYEAIEGGMVSPSGRCLPFSAEADGTVFGHGAGVVLLRRLEDARADGQPVLAVIKGVGLSNDGADRIAFTAPSAVGQRAAVDAALADAGAAPGSIGYVECHGTATPLGDPIEVAGLSEALAGAPEGSVALGSAKGTVGHLDAAAGAVGVIKAVGVLSGRIPPVPGLAEPNPRMPLDGTPLRLPRAAEDWQAGTRRAGVSAFGVGGTNAHVVLEAAPPAPAATEAEGPQILPLSARTPEALSQMAGDLADALEGASLADAAFTLQEGRRALPHRLAVAACAASEAAAALRRARPRKAASHPILFLFPGQGAQRPGMGAGLMAEPAYAEWIERGMAQLAGEGGPDLAPFLTREGGDAEALTATALAQPALYLSQYACARLWEARGVLPGAILGHSIGEVAGAAIAGVMSFEDGLRLAAARGRLMAGMPRGAMLSVRAGEAALSAHLTGAVEIAAVNGPKACVAAGPGGEIDALAERLGAAGIAVKPLRTSHAFHSAAMDGAVGPLREMLEGVTLRAPRIPMISAATGAPLAEDQARSPEFWAAQMRRPVRFADALAAAPPSIGLEIGASGPLTALASPVLPACVPSLPAQGDDRTGMAAAAGALWAAGAEIDWSAQGPRGARIAALPTYAFQRRRHFVEPDWGSPDHAQTQAAPAARPEPAMTAPATMPATEPRQARLSRELLALFADLSGEELGEAEAAVPFLELGFDSLFMGQAVQALSKSYGFETSFRALLSDFPSIAALAAEMDRALPPEAAPEQPPAPAPAPTQISAPAAVSAPAPASAPAGDMAALIEAQMRAMRETFEMQIRAMGGAAGAPAAQAPAAAPAPAPAPAAPAPSHASAAPEEAAATPRFKVGRGASAAPAPMTPEQDAFVADLARRYSERFPLSKAHVDEMRPAHADPRSAAGFRPDWKEMTFPIVSDRSKGAWIEDMDGGRLVDLVNGFGQTAFGHAPGFVSEAVARQMDEGYAIGPLPTEAGRLARRVARMVGHERVTFCNTGSEAVMAAMRLARAVTGNETVVTFSGDYHGQFDEVLVKGKRSGAPGALPIAPGIPRAGVSNMVVLPYGDPASLEWIRENIGSLAAVLVEPVQSRRPELRPRAFVQEIRDLTARAGAALIMDEVVTGFRVGPDGVQGAWGIRGDMATYGKVLGGGMPIGVLAGSARFMDALDGGQWRFGDDSEPQVSPTFFAGTFVRHPLVLAAVGAVMDHLEEHGDALWTDAADLAGRTAERMNDALAARGLPPLVNRHSSWFTIDVTRRDPRASLLFPLMRLHGVHYLEGFCGFWTTEHGEEEADLIVAAFEAALDELRGVGILTGDLPEGRVPTTDAQREVWMIHQLGDRAACAFNETVALRLDGAPDEEALTEALSGLVRRHDALRARFSRTGEGFEIAPPHRLAPVPDARPLAEVLGEEARKPVDIVEGPPIRARLVSDDGAHALVLTAHHIVCDGWSWGVMLPELAALYAEATGGPAADLAPAPSFAALAAEGRGPDAADLAWWTAHLDGAGDAPDLPTDRPATERRGFAGATTRARLDAGLVSALRKAGGRSGATLFGTLFGGLQATLSRLAGTRDVILGVPFAGQTLLEDQALVGHCVNLLPVRAPIAEGASAAEHLAAATAALTGAMEHGAATYDRILRALDLHAAPGRMPLTQVQFNLDGALPPFAMGDLTATVSPGPKAATNWLMFVNAAPEPDGAIRLDVDFDTERLDEATVLRWCALYEEVLRAVAADPARPLDAIGADDGGVASGPALDTRGATLPALFEAQAARTPDRLAVEGPDGALTYAELEARSAALASEILRRGPGPGARVAVCVPRGGALVAALLGVHRAGCAYVPLDPAQPAARLAEICRTAEVAMVVSPDGALARDLGAPHLDPAEASGRADLPAVGDDAAAYVIFTSGSTGAPKGVEVGHRALASFLLSMADRPGLTEDDTVLSVTTPMFDICALELFGPLVVGGRCVVASAEDVRAAFPVARRIEAGDVTVVQATPTLMAMLVEAGLSPRPGLRLLLGGEALPSDLAHALAAGGAEVWNMYGPTETTIWSACGRVGPEGPITIGDPIANTDLVVLDASGRPVPVGAEGELFIGGAGLAEGYYGRPDLTAEAFREMEVGGRRRRLYATGDLARRREAGIELLGRRDGQVKLRGFRIELGEIEARLRALPGIAQAAVALRERAGDARLVGYLVAEGGATPDTAGIEAALAGALPDYMVPRAWARIDALPRSPAGKLDRRALPEPDEAAPRAAVPPATPTEARIAPIWSAVLGAEVSVTDSLYALGADSLAIFRIAARMLDEGLGLEAKHMIEHPSVRALAAFADGREDEGPARPSLRDFARGARRERRAS